MINEGEKAPDFSLFDQNDNPVRLSDFQGKKAVVLFFYPKDDTEGRMVEACGFQEHFPDFTREDVELIGVSEDPPESQRRFSRTRKLQYRLLSDSKGNVRKLFGVRKAMGVMPGRATFVIDRNGRVVKRIYSQFRFLRHVKESLRAVRAMRGRQFSG